MVYPLMVFSQIKHLDLCFSMKRHIFLFIATVVFAAVCGDDEEAEGARLLVAKHIHNKYLVENMDIIVKVSYPTFFLINMDILSMRS